MNTYSFTGGRNSSHVMQVSVKLCDSVHYSALLSAVCPDFESIVAALKLKHALWFAATIGNMQFSLH